MYRLTIRREVFSNRYQGSNIFSVTIINTEFTSCARQHGGKIKLCVLYKIDH